MESTYGEQRRIEIWERQLVRRLLAGDELAYREFCDGYLPVLHRFAASRLKGDRELVLDVVQSTACKALAKLDSYRGDACLVTWLCAICRNEIAGHFRKRGGARREIELVIEEVDAASARRAGELAGPERDLQQRERAELVHVALDELPPHYGRVLEWKYLDELPVDEIARRLELSPKAAESLLTRARRAFRGGFERLERPNAPVAPGAGTRTVLA